MTQDSSTLDNMWTTSLYNLTKQEDWFIEEQIGLYIDIYYRSAVHILGVIGNILTFIIMTRQHMRRITTYSYMATIAVFDLLTLSISIFFWINRHFTLPPQENGWGCRVYLTLFYFAIHTSVSLLVAMTVEKFILIWFPLKAQYLVSITKARIVIAAIIVCIFVLNSNHLFTRPDITFKVTESGNSTTCMGREFATLSVNTNLKVYHLYIWPWIDATLYSFIPITSLIIFNSLILYKLKSSDSKRIKLTQRQSTKTTKINSANDKASRTNRQITIMLLLVTSCFVILTMPLAVMLIVEKYWRTNTGHEKAIKGLIYKITESLMFTNHAANFYLYCVSSERFRKEVAMILCCHRNQESGYSKTSPTLERKSSISVITKL